MKKNILKISFIVFATLVMVSCNNEFLERIPLDAISNDSFWNTESDLKNYNNNFYNMAKDDINVTIMMGHHNGFDSQWAGYEYLDGYSDNTAPIEPRGLRFAEVRAGIYTIPNNAQDFGWRGWNFLRAINIGMDNYGKANVSEAVRNKYIAEARLFRGWFYADKVEKFGDVTWVDHELTTESEELNAPRTPRLEVMENVLADLDFACANLPSTQHLEGDPGRFNRWVALAVKARVCLFEGTWQKYRGMADANKWLTEAAAASKELIQNGPYRLYTSSDMDHVYNYTHRALDLSGNPEVIYWRKYATGVEVNHFQSYHAGYNGGATKDAVEDYLCKDGLPITLSPLYKGDAVYEDIFVDRDPRLRQTILHPEDQPYYRYGNHDYLVYTYPRIKGTAGGRNTATGYHIIKVYENNAASAAYNVSTSPAITLRLAEAMLIYAEAVAELGTITQDDLDMSINKLRDRVGMPHLMLNPPMDPRYANLGISSTLVEIRRERRIELFMEGFRYDDLRRWKLGKKLEQKDLGMRWDEANQTRFDPQKKATVKTTMVNGIPYLDPYQGTDYGNPVFDESKHYLWPIPINSISQNPALGQNPGW
ncbi:MAG TPA: RagB/SusD family nutrient uptake outer membrane protein [Draconibacterium sp.]|nr:RagB/SusD family nutrient uptake outer membrane protein [Draconibacterium sp.]